MWGHARRRTRGSVSRNEDDSKRLDREYESSSRALCQAWKATVPESIPELAPSFLVSTTHNFDADRELGRGTFFGKVYQGVDPERGLLFAVKKHVEPISADDKGADQVRRKFVQEIQVRQPTTKGWCLYALWCDNDRLLANPDQGTISQESFSRFGP